MSRAVPAEVARQVRRDDAVAILLRIRFENRAPLSVEHQDGGPADGRVHLETNVASEPSGIRRHNGVFVQLVPDRVVEKGRFLPIGKKAQHPFRLFTENSVDPGISSMDQIDDQPTEDQRRQDKPDGEKEPSFALKRVVPMCCHQPLLPIPSRSRQGPVNESLIAFTDLRRIAHRFAKHITWPREGVPLVD